MGRKRRAVHEERKLNSRNRKYEYEPYVGMKPKKFILMWWYGSTMVSSGGKRHVKYLEQSQNPLPDISTNTAESVSVSLISCTSIF